MDTSKWSSHELKNRNLIDFHYSLLCICKIYSLNILFDKKEDKKEQDIDKICFPLNSINFSAKWNLQLFQFLINHFLLCFHFFLIIRNTYTSTNHFFGGTVQITFLGGALSS